MPASFLLIAAAALCVTAAMAVPARAASPLWVYVGGKTGIGLFRFDLASAELTPQPSAAPIGGGFLAFSPDHRFLYAITTTIQPDKKRLGEILAFSVDRIGGQLTLLNRQPSGGDEPCFVAVDSQAKNALVTNYSSATVAVFPLASDGTLGSASCTIKHAGSSINPKRQTHAYAHSVNLDPSGHFAFVADLGADKLFIYRFDSTTGTLTPAEPPAMIVPPGSGPRHLSFGPAGRFAYLVNEMGGTVIAYSFDPHRGTLSELQQISTLPPDFKGNNTSAEVLVHPSGKFLYASNRGDTNFITIFAIDPASHKLSLIAYQSSVGKTPRNFRIDPTGKFMIVANQDSSTIVLFSIDDQTGKLTPIGQPLPTVAAPICVKFLEETP
jgi:6-phosphogluconolactonase